MAHIEGAQPSADFSTEQYRPAFDANHTDAWLCKATDGTNVLPDVGAVTLVASAANLLAVPGVAYRGANALVNVDATPTGKVNLRANVTFSNVASFSIECVATVPTPGDWGASPILIGAYNVGGEYVYLFPYNGAPPSASWRFSAKYGGGAWPAANFTGGGANTQVAYNRSHHFLIVQDIPGTAFNAYVDGVLVAQLAGVGTFTNPLTQMYGELFANGAAIADIRVSNVARTQAYAVAATRALRIM